MLPQILPSGEITGSPPVVLGRPSERKEGGRGASTRTLNCLHTERHSRVSNAPKRPPSSSRGTFTRRADSVFSKLTAENINNPVKKDTWVRLMNEQLWTQHEWYVFNFKAKSPDSKVRQNPNCTAYWYQWPWATCLTSPRPSCHICKMWSSWTHSPVRVPQRRSTNRMHMYPILHIERDLDTTIIIIR